MLNYNWLLFRSCVYSNDNTGDLYWNRMQNVEPVPRYAHQLVYDHVKKVRCLKVSYYHELFWLCMKTFLKFFHFGYKL